MKKTLLSFLLVVGSLCPGLAQPSVTAGTFYVYDGESLPAMTPAPEGYEPFYISHFARHGARYCTSEYDTLRGWLQQAAEAGVLTGDGEAFRTRFEAFYVKVKDCKGNLTGVGKAQHRAIAERMFQRFPAVFDGPTHVEAVSTESPRVIMSMWSCLSRLAALDGDLDINADASARYASWLQPSLGTNPYLIKGAFKSGPAADEALEAYFDRTVPWKAVAGRLFTSPEVLKDVLKTTPEKFIETLHSVVTGTYCLDTDRGRLDDVFTEEELGQVWKGLSASYFKFAGRYEGSESLILDYAAFTLGQIIESAGADIASGDTQLRLRFGHDSGIAPLLVLLDADGAGRGTASFEESLDIFPSYRIPMAASLQLVFFRNAAGDILVKALVNEREASLPVEPVSGPYYRWSDFKAHYLPLVRASRRKVESVGPLSVLKAVDWGWRPAGESRIETGGASLRVFNSMQTVSMVRFPMWEHAVSVLSSPGKAADITSRLGAAGKALVAINGSYFDKDLLPVTYVKDEGKVRFTRTVDTRTLINGMFLIRDRKGSAVDIVKVDSAGIAPAAKGWREAIAAGPVLLEDGAPVPYESDGSRFYRRFYQGRHPRSVLGYTADGWIYFIVVDGRFPEGEGMSVSELQVLCESLGLYEAINLDGGGSSTLWTRDGGVLNHPYDNLVFDHKGERVVPNAIIVR